jgi:ATP-binding cassette, subfamily B, bacterial
MPSQMNHDWLWPEARLGELLAELGREAGLRTSVSLPSPPAGLGQHDSENLHRWILQTSLALGFEAEPVESPVDELDKMLHAAGPAVLRLPTPEGARFVGLLKHRGGKLVVLSTKVRKCQVRIEQLREPLQEVGVGALRAEVDQILTRVGLNGKAREKARWGLLMQRAGKRAVGGCWLLRAVPQGAFASTLQREGIIKNAGWLLLGNLVYFVLVAIGWWFLGRGMLSGHIDEGYLHTWVLLFFTALALRQLVDFTAGRLAFDVGGLLKQRLLYGTLSLDVHRVRAMGSGDLLGRVIESQSIEQLAMSGGVNAIIALTELLIAAAVLYMGAGGVGHVALVATWVLLTVFLAAMLLRRRELWTQHRLALTGTLVERMLGHRTRLVQQLPERMHDGEDPALANYFDASRLMDRITTLLAALPSRGWVVVALAWLSVSVWFAPPTRAALAVAIGGITMAWRAFGGLSLGLVQLIAARVSWHQVKPIYGFGQDQIPVGDSPDLALVYDSPSSDDGLAPPTVVDMSGVEFEYAGASPNRKAVVKDLSLRISKGDRVLIEGRSGSGKSTLGLILSGLEQPQKGSLQLCGMSWHSLGREGWRRRIASAPQFHQNHVFNSTLRFNLHMGRRWPAFPSDIERAHQLCLELGLGDLIERMPSGMSEIVGERGWQLSHGERSRLFIARALMQEGELVIFDESFAALDPQTLEQVMQCVHKRARTLVVIAHP